MNNIHNNIPLIYPIVQVINNAKDLFEIALTPEQHKQAFDKGLERGLILQMDWSPIKEIASLNNDSQICLHANFCQFLWTLNYTTLIIHDCYYIKEGIRNGEGISKEEASFLFDEALKMFQNALLMFHPKDTNREEMKAQRGPMFEYANPYNKQNRYTDIANEMTISGIAYLLHHEFGHFIYEHDDSTPKTETEADDHGFRTILNWGNKHKDDNKTLENILLIGTMMALVDTAFQNTDLAGQSHPDIDIRIENLFRTYQAISGQEIYDSTLKILITAIDLWSSATQNEKPNIDPHLSPKEYLCRIREEFILPIKRKVKII